MTSESSFVAAATGLRFAYVEQGARGGAAILMLHGYSDTHRSFDLIRPLLPRAWRVIAVTQRGHGGSDKPAAGYAMPDLAADAVAALDALGIERAVLVGHSLGAAVAVQAAADFPERVAGVVSISGFATFADNPDVIELTDAVAGFGDSVDPAFARAFQESTLANPVPPAFLDMVVGESMKCPAHAWRGVANGILGADPARAAARCRAPAALIWGDRDRFVRHADQLVLAEALRARLFTLSGLGHAPHWERPDQAAALLRAFVADTDAADILHEATFA